MKIRRALISVSDKTGLEELAGVLDKLGVEILSTGGTAKKIAEMGINVTEISDYTGFSEMMDGRVKTLHPKVHGGLLALRNNEGHMKQIKAEGIKPIDMVVVNLYPFEQTVSREGVTEEEAIENIDIGGPAMLRSAAKNFKSVAVVSSCGQYKKIISELKDSGGSLRDDTLRELGTAVFRETSEYDSMINRYFAGQMEPAGDALPGEIVLKLHKARQLRYGENPHQQAAVYTEKEYSGGIIDAEQLQGKELSFNNLIDLSAAFEMVNSFKLPAVSIVKHNNPCGMAEADTLKKAYIDALDSDRLSAFGSIMGFNGVIDRELAEIILEEADFVECIIAPGYEQGVFDVFSRKKNLRVLRSKAGFINEKYDMKKIYGGALVQEKDKKILDSRDIKVVTKKAPTQEQMKSLLFGWHTVKFVKSNAIVLCRGTKTVGIGAGQMSRVDSVIIAVRKASRRAEGSTLASDAFFPKSDSIEQAHAAGISAIIQPGGSIRDEEVIRACDEFGISMVFTGMRHFRH